MKQGVLTISLDFELHWGGFEKWNLADYKTYFLNTRKTIPRMLALFRQYDVHVTWAGVGLLFHKNRQELIEDMPALKPTYSLQHLSAYHYIDHHGIGYDEESDPFHFAWSLLEQIRDTPGQEIASHTFSHYYCQEPGQSQEQFRADLMAAQKAARRLGIQLTSLVFPRNQYNDEYLRICRECGFTAVRSNPEQWFWQIKSTQHESMWTRLNRGVDAYLPITPSYVWDPAQVKVDPALPVCLPASRLLRPYRPKEWILNDMKINRICSELSLAAQSGHVYHLWWHPHNFGNFPEQSLAGLEKILMHAARLRDQKLLRSATMRELTAAIVSHEKTAAA